jgi:hypothetical protein
MGRKRRQGNVTPQKSNNNIIEDLMERKGDESLVADLKRMIRKFKELEGELKENMQNNSMNIKIKWIKNSRRHRNN